MKALARWTVPPVALLLAACATAEVAPTAATDDGASPFRDCAALISPPATGAAPPSSPAGGSGAGADLPQVSLPCFTGGAVLPVTELRGPAVINLWASSCAPCREELPLLQELADRTAGRLHVVGVDTNDTRDAGSSFAADKGVSFPTFFDADKKLLYGLGRTALPVTVFVAADGKRFDYVGPALDKPTLGALVREHTGVTVTE